MTPAATPLDPRQRRELWWFLAIAFVVLAAGIGLRQPWPSDEPRFVLVAKQMWESGDWWFPHRGAELYPDKPPLYFWMLGAAYAVVRDWTWAFLLPSLAAAMATLAMTWDLGRRLWSHRNGLWAAVAVLCAVQFLYQSKRAQIDPTAVALITLGMYGILRHLLLGPQWRWYWLGCFAAGLGVIAKGVGFLPLLALLPYAAMRIRGWKQLPDLGRGNGWRWAAGAFAFLVAIALWLVPMVLFALNDGDAQHRAYLDEFAKGGEVVMIGTFGDPATQGSMAIFRSREAAERFRAGDPFMTEGLVFRSRILDWDPLVFAAWVGARTTTLPVGSIRDVQRVLPLLLPGMDDTVRDALAHAAMDAHADQSAFPSAPPRARWLRPFSWRKTGYTIADGVIVIRHGAVWRRVVFVPLARMQSVEVEQGPAHRILDLATADVHLIDGPVHAKVPVIDVRAGEELFALVSAGAIELANAEAEPPADAPVAQRAEAEPHAAKTEGDS